MISNKVKYFIDVGLFFSFLIMTITGIIKFGKLLRFFGINPNYAEMNMAAISAWHDWSGLVLAALVLVHLVIHFDWIVGVTKSFFVKKDKVE